MKKQLLFFLVIIFMSSIGLNDNVMAQDRQATLFVTSEEVVVVPSIASKIADGTFIPAEDIKKEVNEKSWGQNAYVPGKGLPKGMDPLVEKQMQAQMKSGKAPILTFNAATASATPTDPTGAVGPNHFMNSWNSSFRIYDKSGNALIPASSLNNIFPGTLGDPIVMYDRYANRFFISEFYSNGFDVAVSQGPDPVNDGWYVYRYATSSFPDYPKYSVWSDGYYITANKDQGSPTTSEVVFALERDAMLTGDPTAQMIGFSLPGIVNSGFYSPLGFNCNGPTLPPTGDAPIVYMQDDGWSGVTTDHLKIWNIDVNWTTPTSSTISTPQSIPTSAFDGVFDGGSFSNLPQPSGGADIDALQATIMYMAQYRRFSTYNSVVFNFVVDLDGGDDYAGIRWYELRQNNDGDPWSIYQEGTYAPASGHSAFSGNMCMDGNGNIALAYTSVSSSLYPSLRYTGRYAGDALGVMTIAEDVIGNGTANDPSTRYGDYSQMTIDPTDDATFWSIGEYFPGGTRTNRVGVFQIQAPTDPPVADFTADDTAPYTGQTVTFTDASSNVPTSWSWSFSPSTVTYVNGTSSTDQNPEVTFNATGTYTVSLTATNAYGSDTEIKTNYVIVSAPVACSGDIDIDGAGTTTWNYPLSTYYHDARTTSIYLQSDFDCTGGSISAMQYYVTTTPGQTMNSFTIRMRHTSSASYSSAAFENTGWTTVYQATETISSTGWHTFNFSTPFTYNGSDNLEVDVSFDNTSYTSDGYVYTFDGGASRSKYFRTDSGYGDPLTWTHTGSLSVNVPRAIFSFGSVSPPVADFSADILTPMVGQTVTFTDLSSNTPTSWSWSFTPTTVTYVNGTSSSHQNPQLTFNAAGSYTVTLTATNASGSDSETKTNYITVSDCSVNTYPYLQTFDAFTTSSPAYSCTADGSVPLEECWTNVTGDNIDWDVFTGSTGSGLTGPTQDHTSGSGNYLYTETSSCYNNTGYITSPSFDLTVISSPELSFWYHMYGSTMGTLSVQVSTDGGSSWSANIWSLSGNQGNAWIEAVVSLASYTSESSVIIRFTANTGTSYTSDMAIDDVSVDGTTGVVNDFCSGAIAINEVVDYPYNTTTATASGLNPGCGGTTDPVDLWYAYTATVTGLATFDLCGSAYDTRLGLWEDCSGTLIACNDDNGPACSGLQSSIENFVFSGTTYYVQVGGYQNGTGSGDLTIQVVPATPGLWTGALSTDWDTADNWDDMTVPVAGTDVTIPAAATNWPTRTGDLVLGSECNSVTMEGSSELTVTGNLTIPSGYSFVNNAASVINVSGDFTAAGTFTPGTGTFNCLGSSNTSIVAGSTGTAANLTTTFAGGNGAYGNMFDIVALDDVIIDNFEMNLNPGTGDVHIYYKSGTYVGFETNSSAWTFVGTTSVTSTGNGFGTSIPISVGVSIPSGQTYAFYIHADNGNAYTNGTSVGNVYAQDSYIQILEGCGNNTPMFSGNFGPRVFNGVVHYRYITTASVGTTYAGGNGHDGNMFDVVTGIDGIIITGFDCNIDGSGDVDIEVYYRTDTYVGNSGSAGWIYEGTYTVTSAGVGNPSHFDIGGIAVPAGSTYGVYVTIDGVNYAADFDYTNGANSYSDGNITVNTGYGNEYLFGRYYSPRTWNGELYYSIGSGSLSVAMYDLTIDKSAGSSVTLETDVNIGNDLVVEAGSYLTNNTGMNASITGDVYLNGTSTDKSSYLDLGTTTVGGETYVQKYYSDGRWHNISSPVSGGYSAIFLDIYLYSHDEPTNTWFNIVPVDDPLAPGVGYLVWSTIGNPTVVYTGGDLNSGNYSPVLGVTDANTNSIVDATEGWNMVGNAFPSSIDIMGAGYTWSNLDNTIYLYDGTQYVNFNRGTGTGSTGVTQYIPSMQGFFVKVNDLAGGSLTVPNSARLHDDQANYKNDQINDEIRLTVSGNGYTDEMILMSYDEATEGFDGAFDAYKLFGVEEAPQLYTFKDDVKMSLNAYDAFNSEMIIPVALQVGANGLYQLNFTNIELTSIEQSIYLEDIKNGVYYEVEIGKDYSFNHGVADDAHRFNIHFGAPLNLEEATLTSTMIYSDSRDVYVELGDDVLNAEISIYNMLGEKITEVKAMDQHNIIKLNVEDGYYLVKVLSDNFNTSKKVFIK